MIAGDRSCLQEISSVLRPQPSRDLPQHLQPSGCLTQNLRALCPSGEGISHRIWYRVRCCSEGLAGGNTSKWGYSMRPYTGLLRALTQTENLPLKGKMNVAGDTLI